MSQQTASAGNKGDGIRSDCHVQISLVNTGGINIVLKSKVEKLYGTRMDSLTTEILNHYKIDNAIVEIEDSGALDYVLAARIEATIRKLIPSGNPYLLEMLDSNKDESIKNNINISQPFHVVLG